MVNNINKSYNKVNYCSDTWLENAILEVKSVCSRARESLSFYGSQNNLSINLGFSNKNNSKSRSQKSYLDVKGWREIALDYFNKYHDDKKSRCVVLEHKEGEFWLIVRYRTRFEKSYIKQVRDRLKKIKFYEGTMFTFDIDPKLCLYINDHCDFLVKEWNRFWTHFKHIVSNGGWVKRKGKRVKVLNVPRYLQKNPNLLQFVRNLEFGENKDNPHLHVIVDKIEVTRIGYSYFHSIWPFGRAPHIRRINNMNVAKYLIKYIVKSFSTERGYLYWLTNKRFYSTSGNLKTIKEKKESKFAFLTSCWYHDLRETVLKDYIVSSDGYTYLDLKSIPNVIKTHEYPLMFMPI